MKYRLVITEEARDHIKRLDKVIVKKVMKKLPILILDPFGLSKRLVNYRCGTFRYRVGDYRIIFDIREDAVEILKVAHRREVYK